MNVLDGMLIMSPSVYARVCLCVSVCVGVCVCVCRCVCMCTRVGGWRHGRVVGAGQLPFFPNNKTKRARAWRRLGGLRSSTRQTATAKKPASDHFFFSLSFLLSLSLSLFLSFSPSLLLSFSPSLSLTEYHWKKENKNRKQKKIILISNTGRLVVRETVKSFRYWNVFGIKCYIKKIVHNW